MAINDPGRRLAAWIDARIEEMLAAPGMWGTSLEAVEMQVITLLEVRALALDIEREIGQPGRVLDEYVRLLGEHFVGEPPRPAHQAVGEGGVERFVALLRDVSERLRGPAPADDFFDRTYLGIELNFAPGHSLSTQAVTSYYEDFRRATRSLARLGSGKTGRVEKSIELATNFTLESMQIMPLNGVPARARLALGAPYGQMDAWSNQRVHGGLEQMLEAAALADAEGPDILEFGAALDPDARTRALMQTIRVLPRGDIEEITIGGRYIARDPVRLRKLHAPKLMAAVAVGMEPSLYDQTATIRAIDLDRGSILHGTTKDNRVLCYIPSDVFHEITEVGVTARIVGHRYEPKNRSPFVIGEQLELIAN